MMKSPDSPRQRNSSVRAVRQSAPQGPRQDRHRSGFTILEMLVSATLLGTVMALAVPTLRWVGHERRDAQRRLLAISEVENAMELLTAQPWESLTPEYLEQVELPEYARIQLPDSEWKLSLQEQDEAKRIHIELQWRADHGRLVAPVRLSAWSFRRGEPE